MATKCSRRARSFALRMHASASLRNAIKAYRRNLRRLALANRARRAAVRNAAVRNAAVRNAGFK